MHYETMAQITTIFAAYTAAKALIKEKWGIALEMLAVAVIICVVMMFASGRARADGAEEITGRASFITKAQRVACRGAPRFDPEKLTAAHRTLPCGTRVEVRHKGKAVIVTITDRGPARRDRVIDISRAAARELGFLRAGVAKVSFRVVEEADPAPAARPVEVDRPETVGSFDRRFRGCTPQDPCEGGVSR